MEVSPQDPPLMAMDLSKSYSRRTRSHPDPVDLAKKPEWYHTTTSSSSSSYRTRASSPYASPLSPQQPGAVAHCRDLETDPEPLGGYMSSTLPPRLDLYRDGNLWHSGFYRPDQGGSPAPESSGGEESDSGSDVIFLVSSAKEPILCSSFIQDGVRHIVEPLSPAVSSMDEGRSCYHLPQPLSSPSPDSSYSEDSSDSSVEIPVHHARPVVLLSDLNAVYDNAAESTVGVSSDDSDVIEVSVTDEKKKQSCCRRKSPSPPPQRERKKPLPRIRRSSRIKGPVSDVPQFTCRGSRDSLRRQAKNDAVGIYNESCDSDDMMEFAVRVSSSDESAPQQNDSKRGSSNSESESEVRTNRKSPQPGCKAAYTKRTNHKRTKPSKPPKTKRLKRTKQKENCEDLEVEEQHEEEQQKEQEEDQKEPEEDHEEQEEDHEEQEEDQKLKKAPARRKTTVKKKPAGRQRRKRRPQTGPAGLFSPQEPEIKLKYAQTRKERKEKKMEGFFPFVRMEQRTCTVVNYQEEEESVQTGRQTASSSLSGFVPTTSCFRLGRLGSEVRCPASLLCCMCGQTANSLGLGDLHGPYYPVRSPSSMLKSSVSGREDPCRLSKSQSGNSSEDDSAAKSLADGEEEVPAKLPSLHLNECWIHEDCGIWSAGVFLVRGRLYGLEEAARLAQDAICSSCQQTGAIMGCFQKGCSRNYHYRCAIQSGCVLNEENFSMRCPEHKNKPITTVTRRHKR